jgi:hypothetical protein
MSASPTYGNNCVRRLAIGIVAQNRSNVLAIDLGGIENRAMALEHRFVAADPDRHLAGGPASVEAGKCGGSTAPPEAAPGEGR